MRVADDDGHEPNRERRRTTGSLGVRPQTPGVYRIGPRARKDEKSVHPRTNGRPCSRPSWALGSHSCVALSSHEVVPDYPLRRPPAIHRRTFHSEPVPQNKREDFAARRDIALDRSVPFMDSRGQVRRRRTSPPERGTVCTSKAESLARTNGRRFAVPPAVDLPGRRPPKTSRRTWGE